MNRACSPVSAIALAITLACVTCKDAPPASGGGSAATGAPSVTNACDLRNKNGTCVEYSGAGSDEVTVAQDCKTYGSAVFIEGQCPSGAPNGVVARCVHRSGPAIRTQIVYDNADREIRMRSCAALGAEWIDSASPRGH